MRTWIVGEVGEDRVLRNGIVCAEVSIGLCAERALARLRQALRYCDTSLRLSLADMPEDELKHSASVDLNGESSAVLFDAGGRPDTDCLAASAHGHSSRLVAPLSDRAVVE